MAWRSSQPRGRARHQLEITFGPVRRTVIVRGVAERRVSAAEAKNLYEETEKSVAERERQADLRRLAGPIDLGGARPSATGAATTLASTSPERAVTTAPPAGGGAETSG